MKFSQAFSALVALVPLVRATVEFTAPVGSTTITAGKAFKVVWQDDGTTPTLATFGTGTLSLGIGGTVTQIKLATLGTVNFATATSLSVTIPANVGPAESGQYFIRADSNAVDPTSPYGSPYLAFSAKFNFVGGTGTFNATESQIATGGSSASTTSSSSSSSSASITSTSSLSTITSTIIAPTSGFANASTTASHNSTATILGVDARPLTALGALAVLYAYLF